MYDFMKTPDISPFLVVAGGVGLVLGLALGAAAGGLLLIMAVLAVLLRKWYGTRQKTGLEFDMDDRTTIASSRSAPNTR